MNIKLVVPASEIEKKLNETFEGDLYHDEVTGNLIDIKIIRKDSFSVRTVRNKVLVSVLLHVNAEIQPAGDFSKLLDFTFRQLQETEFDARVTFEVDPRVNEHWELSSTTNGSFEYVREPFVTLGPVKINVSGILRTVMNHEIGEICEKIDDFLRKEVGFRGHIQTAWKELQGLIHLDEELDVWLSLRPTIASVYASALACKDGDITMMISFPSNPIAVMGQKPDETEDKALPDFERYESISFEFTDRFDGEVTFSKLKEMYSGETVEFGNGKYRFTVQQIDFGKRGAKLEVRVYLLGEVKVWLFDRFLHGVLFVEGVPWYDPEKEKVVVEPFELQVKTRNILLKIFHILFKRRLKREFKAGVEKLVNELMVETQEAVKGELKDVELAENVTLFGDLRHFQPKEISVTGTRIQGTSEAGLTLTVRIGDF